MIAEYSFPRDYFNARAAFQSMRVPLHLACRWPSEIGMKGELFLLRGRNVKSLMALVLGTLIAAQGHADPSNSRLRFGHFVLAPQCARTLQSQDRISSFSGLFAEMARSSELLGQRAKSLAKLGLIINGGGLCGLACAASVLSAAYRYAGRAEQARPPEQSLKSLARIFDEDFNIDARYGVGFHDLSHATSELALDGDLDLVAVHLPIEASRGYYESSFSASNNSLKIIAVESSKGVRHALVLTQIETESKRLRYWDPEHPNIIHGAYYSIGIEASSKLPTLVLSISDWDGTSKLWDIYDVIDLQVLELPAL